MFSKLLAVGVALSATTDAMWMPPKLKLPPVVAHLPTIHNNLDNLGPARTGQERATVKVACHDCPLAVGSKHGHPLRWEEAKGADTQLVVDVTSDGSQIFFNGAAIYPQAPGPLGQLIAAKQEYINKNEAHPHELFGQALPLSTGIEVHPAVKTVAFHLDTPTAKDVVEMVPMRRVTIEILGLADRVVRVDTVEIKFSDEDLKIHDARLLPYAEQTSPQADKCTDIFCRVRFSLQSKVAHLQHFIQSKLDSWRQTASGSSSPSSTIPCTKGKDAQHGIKGGMAKFGGKFDADGNFKGFGAPAGHHGHHGHHHGHHHGSALRHFARTAVSFVYHILLPVVFGVAAGMVVSGIGMLLGKAIVFLVRAFFGRSRTGYEVVLVEDPEALPEDEENVDALPKYEEVYVAPPTFEDRKEQTDE